MSNFNQSNNFDISSLTFEKTEELKRYLRKLIELGGSDLHIKTGATIRARVDGELVELTQEKLGHDFGITLAKEMLRTRFSEFIEMKNIDLIFKLDESYRFRVNLFFQIEGVSGVFRVIPTQLPTFESLNLPKAIKKFCSLKRGLVLVTGPTGCGKTTTLASMINYINQNYNKHIITIEDPVEFMYKDDKSIINQRGVGQDAVDFASALRAALREDPNIILVGEIRDVETLETALHAAETGHLVLSTIHTNGSAETVSRIISMFPGDEQERIRISLFSALQGVISQRLLRAKNGGRVAAIEVMVKTARIDSLILESRDSEITDAIAEGKEIYGSQTFDQALLELYVKDVITKDEAIHYSNTPNNLILRIDIEDAKRNLESTEANNENVIKLKRTKF